MAWAGTGVLAVVKGGVLKTYGLSALAEGGGGDALNEMKGSLTFVQISDSHMGFNKPANTDVAATLQAAVDKINALSRPPAFILHTGDISHLSRPQEFDNVEQILKGTKIDRVFHVPGEHDVLTDNGKDYLARYGKNSQAEAGTASITAASTSSG